jgi:transcriptional regulator with XRE-family HTH domain
MKKSENELNTEYLIEFWIKARELSDIRKTKMSQEAIAFKLGVSTKTIQRFERFKSMDNYLLWGYQKILNT